MPHQQQNALSAEAWNEAPAARRLPIWEQKSLANPRRGLPRPPVRAASRRGCSSDAPSGSYCGISALRLAGDRRNGRRSIVTSNSRSGHVIRCGVKIGKLQMNAAEVVERVTHDRFHGITPGTPGNRRRPIRSVAQPHKRRTENLQSEFPHRQPRKISRRLCPSLSTAITGSAFCNPPEIGARPASEKSPGRETSR